MKYSAGFIGAGNMGSALASAVYKASQNIAFCDKHEDKLNTLKAALTGAEITDMAHIAENAEFIFLAVKPNVILSVAEKISGMIKPEAMIVTMAAGITLEDICSAAKTDRCIRIMPNTPAAVGEGMTLYCCADGIADEDEAKFLSLMSASGVVDKLDEKLFDAASALSGCGPAYVYMFAQALADGAVACGLPRAKAALYAAQMIYGSAALLKQSDKHPEKLKDEVCSPGGTTIEGVLALEKTKFRSGCANAVIAAYEKTAKLKK